MTVELRVAGQAAPQGSKSAYIRGGKAIVVDGSSKTGRASHAAWRQAVATAARDFANETPAFVPFTGPVKLTVVFALARPASKPKRIWWPAVKPDVDKLLRSTCDALTGIVYKDDSQIVVCEVAKVYTLGIPGARMVICELEQSDASLYGEFVNEERHERVT